MPYCPRCGELVPEDASYCPKCGYRLRPTRFKVGGGLQRYWFKRVLAYLIDAVIVSITMMILSFSLSIPLILLAILRGGWRGWGFTLPISMGFIQVIYFTVMEWSLGSTVGKKLMDLEVKGVHSLLRAFMRNLTKLHIGLLILDIVAGFLLGDPRRKFMDIISGTWVVEHGAARGLDPYRDGGGEEFLGKIGLSILIIALGILLITRPNLPLTVVDWLRIWSLLTLGLWLLASTFIRLLRDLNPMRAIDESLLAAIIPLSALLSKGQLMGLLPLYHLPPLLILMETTVMAVYILRALEVSGS